MPRAGAVLLVPLTDCRPPLPTAAAGCGCWWPPLIAADRANSFERTGRRFVRFETEQAPSRDRVWVQAEQAPSRDRV